MSSSEFFIGNYPEVVDFDITKKEESEDVKPNANEERVFDINDYLKKKIVRKEYKPGYDVGTILFPNEYFCTLCEVKSSGPVPFQNHIGGAKHKAKVQESGGVIPENEAKFLRKIGQTSAQTQRIDGSATISAVELEHGYLYCEVCDVKTSGKSNYEDHLKGLKHNKKLKAKELSGTAAGTSTKVPGNVPLPKLPTKPLVNKQIESCDKVLVGVQCVTEIHSNNPKTEVRYVCSLCDSKCDPRNVINHLYGIRHRLNFLKKFDTERFNSIAAQQLKRSECVTVLDGIIQELSAKEQKQDVKMEIEIDPLYDPTAPTKRKMTEDSFVPEKRAKGVDSASRGRGSVSGGRGATARGRGSTARGGRGSATTGRGYGRGRDVEESSWSNFSKDAPYNARGGQIERDTFQARGLQGGGRGVRGQHQDYYSQEDGYGPYQYDDYPDHRHGDHYPEHSYHEGHRDYSRQDMRNNWEGPNEPYLGWKRGTDPNKPTITQVLEKLTDTGRITNEAEAAVALEVSNALTQALLSYRLNKTLT